MKKAERATGIIRTLPSIYNGTDGKKASVGFVRYQKSIQHLEAGKIPAIYIALQCIPKIEVLHMYLLIEGEIRVRMNIAGYEPGDARICWDTTIRQPKFWAVCTAPVSKPPEPMKWKGFQGIRYTDELW
jgi:hypothetical protein